jgi:hypothetical protein
MAAEQRAAEQDRVREQVGPAGPPPSALLSPALCELCSIAAQHAQNSCAAQLCSQRPYTPPPPPAFTPLRSQTRPIHAAAASPPQYDAANRARRLEQERDARWLAQLARPARVAYRQGAVWA